MVLIIPSIPIVHGVCGAQIAIPANESLHAERDIYSQGPIDRARLLRKENAKMVHLEFLDRSGWEPRCIELIRAMRQSVDVPIGISLSEPPRSKADCEVIFQAGAYRIFLPLETPESVYLNYCATFSSRKIIPKVELSFPFEEKLPEYRAHGIERLGVEISWNDTLETGVIDWPRLEAVSAIAASSGMRLTALHGVRGYPELKHLQDLNPALDSLILCRALNENRFPCQLIWREAETAAAIEENPSSNLWRNPLEGRPHI